MSNKNWTPPTPEEHRKAMEEIRRKRRLEEEKEEEKRLEEEISSIQKQINDLAKKRGTKRIIINGFIGSIVGLLIATLFSPVMVTKSIKGLVFPVFCFAGMTTFIIIGIIRSFWQQHQLLKAEENTRLQLDSIRLKRQEELQQIYYEELLELGEQSLRVFESVPNYLMSAERYLDQAENHFNTRMFGPFWDSIEQAALSLSQFKENILQIQKNSSQYTELIRKYEGKPPEFPISLRSVKKLDLGMATAERIQALVRKAQSDFQFAMIYEQRKTSQILKAGFKNLAEALEQMTWQITYSIDNLNRSMDVMTSTLNESMHVIQSRIKDFAKMTDKRDKEQAVREERVLEMLEKIQRFR